MTDTAHEEVIQEEVPIEDGAEVSTDAALMGQLRKLREEARQEKHLDLEIPGYEGILVARFRPYPVAQSEAKADQLRKQMGKRPVLLQMACDGLIDACGEIFVRPTPDSDLSPIDNETPVRFDSRLADYLDIKNATTARQVVIGTYPTEQAILDASVKVSEWLKDTSVEVDGALLGE